MTTAIDTDVAKFDALLAQQIRRGIAPLVKDCTYTHEGFYAGQLVALGWAKKAHCHRTGDIYWTYTGPNSIRVNDAKGLREITAGGQFGDV